MFGFFWKLCSFLRLFPLLSSCFSSNLKGFYPLLFIIEGFYPLFYLLLLCIRSGGLLSLDLRLEVLSGLIWKLILGGSCLAVIFSDIGAHCMVFAVC